MSLVSNHRRRRGPRNCGLAGKHGNKRPEILQESEKQKLAFACTLISQSDLLLSMNQLQISAQSQKTDRKHMKPGRNHYADKNVQTLPL